MKKARTILTVGVLVVLLVACGSAIKRGTAQQWLDTQGRGSKHNVSGSWKGPEGAQGGSFWWGAYGASYGTIQLVQEGTRLSGTYGEYEIIGRISGDQVYLVGLYGDVVYYTWFMRYVPEANSMIGKMCEGYTTQVQDYCTPLTLEKGK